MKRFTKKIVALLLSLAMMLSMSAGIVFAGTEDGGTEFVNEQAYSGTITLSVGDNDYTITGEDILAADSVTATEEEPWTYTSKGVKKEATGTFYSLKSILTTKGIDTSECHGLTAVSAKDGFTTGFGKDLIDDIYIFDQGEVVKAGAAAGLPGTYGTAINGSAGNKWATEVGSIAVADTHVMFFKDGECKHYCAICNEDEATEPFEAVAPTCTESGKTAGEKYSFCGAVVSGGEEDPALGHSYKDQDGVCQHICSVCGADEPSIALNPDTDNITIHECEIQAASSVEATEESKWTDQKGNEYTGIFYSLKSILENANVDYADCHGLTTKASDGFTNGFKSEDIENIYIYDMGTVNKNGTLAGKEGTYGTALNGGQGNKWARDIVNVEIADSCVMFFKDGECKHYCAICSEDEATEPFKAVAPTYTKEGKTAGEKYSFCGTVISGGEVVPVLAKKAQPMTVTAKKAVTVKYSKLRKKAQTLTVSKTLTIKKYQGKRSYKITKVNKAKKYFRINAKTGTITVKKGLKRGTYKVTVKVTAAGNTAYKAGSRSRTITIKVK